MRVLIFGDSITQGFWDSEGGWVQRLRSDYDARIMNDWSKNQPAIFNLGVSGNTSGKVLERFDAETKARLWPGEDYAFVIAVGTNDACVEAGKAWSSPKQYGENIAKILDMAKKYSSKALVVEIAPCDESRTTPVAWGDYSYRNADIQQLNKSLHQVCETASVPVWRSLTLSQAVKKNF
jgi:lysophospholipase L1-like esterase